MTEEAVGPRPLASSRLAPVQPSASMAVSTLANELRAQGRDIIDLGLGEPDFRTPAHIIDGASAAAHSGQTIYTPTAGSLELRQAVAGKLRKINAVEYATNEIIISNGAKQSIFVALMASLEEGDEVLLCAPYFGSYKDIALVLGATPTTVDADPTNGFRLTPERLDAAITPSTRWLILNHPANPSGATYTRVQLRELGEVLARHSQVLVLSDEIYEHITFDDEPFVSFASACPELRDRTLIVNGVSKAYAMTGWRIGYAAGPVELVKAMTTVQSQASSGPSSVSQAGAVVALNGSQHQVAAFAAAFERRRDIVVDAVAAIPELDLDAPGGAFYAYIGCADLIGATTAAGTELVDDVAVTSFLLDEAGVAAVPGAAYGCSPFFRLSTASSDELLIEAMRRIASAVQTLTRR